MGSPYFVHSFNRVSVVKTLVGLERVINLAMTAAGSSWKFKSLLENLTAPDRRYDCETQLFSDIMEKCCEAIRGRRRIVLFLEARYYWTGWEKFQSAIVFDFSSIRSENAEKLAFLASFYTHMVWSDAAVDKGQDQLRPFTVRDII